MIFKKINSFLSSRYLSFNSTAYKFSSQSSNNQLIIDKHEKVEIFYSDSNDIYYNLALEQLLFEQDLKVPRLMLWKNKDAVIIVYKYCQQILGKYQNQWQECNMYNLKQDKVPFIRRKTGGGTVYHDMGNICFSFITPIYHKDIYPLDPRQYNVQILQNAMKSIGIETGLTKRKDLTINSQKISGSAYQASLGNKHGEGKKCLHHGTLLVSADLNRLWHYLKPKEKQITSKAQGSVVSTVCNIVDYYPGITDDNLYHALSESFVSFFGVQQFTTSHFKYNEMIIDPFIQKEINEFKSWEWTHGKTPKFDNKISIPYSSGILNIELEQAEGYVSKMDFQFDDQLFYYAEIALNDLFSNNKIIYGIQEICDSITLNVIENNVNLSQLEIETLQNEILPALSHLL